MKKKLKLNSNNKIIYLLILALFLAISIVISSFVNKNTYNVYIYLEGENANLARVADLIVDYDKNNLELVSATTGGFLDNSTVFNKKEWGNNRVLLMSTETDLAKPVLKLVFKSKVKPENIKLSENSMVYLSNIGAATLPSNGIRYIVKYE